MSFEDPQRWGDLDSGGNALDWTTRKNKFWYPGHEMLRKALVERCEASGTNVPNTLQVARTPDHKIYTPAGADNQFLFDYQQTITDLIPKFVNHTHSDGNWNGASGAAGAFAPAWTEEDILKELDDWGTDNGVMSAYSTGVEIEVTLDDDVNVLEDKDAATVTWLWGGVPKTRTNVVVTMDGLVAHLFAGEGDNYPNSVGLDMTIESGRIGGGQGPYWNIFRADWTLQQYRILNLLRWLRVDLSATLAYHADEQLREGDDGSIPLTWAEAVADYNGNTWVDVAGDGSFTWNQGLSYKADSKYEIARKRAKGKIPAYTFATNIDWYGWIYPETASGTFTHDDEGKGFSQSTYWRYEANTAYIANEIPISGYPNDNDGPTAEPPNNDPGKVNILGWRIRGQQYAIIKFDVLSGFQFVE